MHNWYIILNYTEQDRTVALSDHIHSYSWSCTFVFTNNAAFVLACLTFALFCDPSRPNLLNIYYTMPRSRQHDCQLVLLSLLPRDWSSENNRLFYGVQWSSLHNISSDTLACKMCLAFLKQSTITSGAPSAVGLWELTGEAGNCRQKTAHWRWHDVGPTSETLVRRRASATTKSSVRWEADR